jgi:uncharacterized lipoprotein YddW (UPF0748 family)
MAVEPGGLPGPGIAKRRRFGKEPCLLSLLLAVFLLFVGVGALGAQVKTLPEVPREFRAAWVATVSNIDWPSAQNLSSEEQQAELIQILDTAARLNLNAIIFQVRPMFDALYLSELEPWSEYLTGTMGKAPDPFYDPLEFIIREAHQRGLELHAWFNPYRARHSSARSEIAAGHVANSQPRIVREIGDYLWADPTEEATKRHTLDVILDVVRRYAVDGVHIDDYFYPYPSYSGGADFPDEDSWQRYRADGGELDRDDWRRHHVNDFVARFYREVKQEDPLVKVGISPFGIWRPGHPEGIAGFDQYAQLYADARLWLNEGSLDYIAPQLYWDIGQEKQSYIRLLEWWVEQNSKNRHVWPGNSPNRIRPDGQGRSPEEIQNQILATRDQPGAGGNVHFSIRAFTRNVLGVADLLRDGPYAQPALAPPSPWLSESAPARPDLTARLSIRSGERVITWTSRPDDEVRLWVVYRKENGAWSYQIVPAAGKETESLRLPAGHQVTEIAVSAVNRAGNESRPAWRRLQ